REDPGGGRPRLLHPPARPQPARAAAWRAGPGQAPMSKPLPAVLAFDVFGTVVDWHGTISREVDALGLGISGSDFATEWRAGYAPAMDRVRKGELGWTRIDDLHRMILDGILERHGIDGLDEAARRQLNLVWHRLAPW